MTPYQLAVCGCGPAGLSPLLYMEENGKLEELLKLGLCIIEESDSLGTGNIGKYQITANSLGKVFTEMFKNPDSPLWSHLQPKNSLKIKTCSIQGDVKNINMIGPGELFGELSLIQAPSIGTAIASEDSVVWFIRVTKLKELITSSDIPLMMLFNSILKKLSSLVETTFLSSGEQQIAHSLLKLSELSQKNQIIIMQKDLAEYAGITRMTLNTVLKKWKNDGIISMENKAITILEPDVLHAYSKMNAL